MPKLKERPVPYMIVLHEALSALEALLRGDRLTTFLPELERFNSSLINVALMPILIAKWEFTEDDDLELFMVDFLNRRGGDHGIPSMRHPARERMLLAWHGLVLRLVSDHHLLTAHECQDLRALANLIDAMAHAAPNAETPSVLRRRIEIANTTVAV